MFLISKMGPDASSLVEVIVRGLRSPDVGTREQATIALGNMGANASGFVDELKKRMKDSDALVRLAARRAIAQINEDVKEDVKEQQEKNGFEPTEEVK